MATQTTIRASRAGVSSDSEHRPSAVEQNVTPLLSRPTNEQNATDSVDDGPAITASPASGARWDEHSDKIREEHQRTAESLAEARRQLASAESLVAALRSEANDIRRLYNAKHEELETVNGRIRAMSDGFARLEGRAPTEEQKSSSVKLYSQGLEALFRGNSAESAKVLSEAIALHPRDARYRYFRGLAYSRQNLSSAAKADFQDASYFENRGEPKRAEVSTALERIQGRERETLESFRPKPQE